MPTTTNPRISFLVCLLLSFTVTTTVAQESARLDFRSLSEKCNQQLKSSIVDFYLPHCVDQTNGGYLETIDADGKFCESEYKFLTLQSRQMWFFCQLAINGIEKEESLAAAKSGYDFLQAHFLAPSSRLGVFTSGAFSQGEGIVSGFDRGGTLVTNGLLEVRSTENLRIRVDAFGETGDEEFQVFLAGQLQGTFNVSQELESYFLTVPDFGEQNGFGTGADRDSLIIKFINDDFGPATGLDNNLTITGFQLIDLESDNRIIRRPGSSDVFTTGTFVDGGIEPGFGRGNTLHANGVFSSGPGFIG